MASKKNISVKNDETIVFTYVEILTKQELIKFISSIHFRYIARIIMSFYGHAMCI